MFTGIVTSTAPLVRKVTDGSHLRLSFESTISEHLHINQSIAHNGTCLSVETQEKDTYSVIVIAETLRNTNFSRLEVGEFVNIERAMLASERFEGHYVQGHVDTCVTCLEAKKISENRAFVFDLPPKYRAFVVEKGSICLNGVSLTAHNVTDRTFSVSLTPYTYSKTTFSQLQVGHEVNVEFDIFGKYIARALRP